MNAVLNKINDLDETTRPVNDNSGAGNHFDTQETTEDTAASVLRTLTF
jgi:hypothetical protein